MKNTNGNASNVTPPKTHAQQHFHNHNASLGRIPSSAVNNRHSRELSGSENRGDEQTQVTTFQQVPGLQANAIPFGPPVTMADAMASQFAHLNINPQYIPAAFYGGYGMQFMNMGMFPAQMNNPLAFNQQLQVYQPQPQPQNGFSGYQNQNYGQQGRFQDSQAMVIRQRRMQNGEGRVAHIMLLSFLDTDNTDRERALQQRPVGEPSGRDLRLVQRSTWLSLLAEEARGKQSSACPSHFP